MARRMRGLALAIAGLVAVTLAPATAAHAAVGLVSPVSGHVDEVVGGCGENGRADHEGVDINQNGGTGVYAAAAGTIDTAINSSASTGYGTQVVIRHADGYVTRYAHMVNGSVTLNVGATVTQGQRIGTVGTTGNSTGEHMHFEIYRNGANITNLYFYCGMPNVTAKQAIGAGPTTPPITDRSFSITTAGVLQGKTGMNEPVVQLRTGVASVDADGTTVAAVDTSGNVWVQQGSFSNGWTGLVGGAKAVAVDGDRYVVLKNDGSVVAKDGLYSTNWSTLLTGASKIDAADGRVGVLKNGHIYVKQGALNAGWVDQGGGFTELALDGNRLGAVSGGIVHVKEGDLYAGWVTMRAGSRVQLEGSRVAVLTPEGIVAAKEGDLYASWVNLTGPGASDFSLSGNRVGIVSGGSLLIKTGALNAPWIGAYAFSKAVKLS